MKVGDLASGSARLHNAWKKLRVHWEATRQDWNDAVSREFEETYLTALEPHLDATLERMRTLAGLFNTAEHECDR